MIARPRQQALFREWWQCIIVCVSICWLDGLADTINSGSYTIPGLDSSIIDKYLKPGADQSLVMLNFVTGSLSNISELAGRTSSYAEVMKSLVDMFTRGMFSIAIILFSYTTIMSTIYTADEGEVMGRKFQTFFILFRSLLAMGLYFPMQSGYSILQTMISTIVITSVMVANAAWYTVITLTVTLFNGPFSLSLLSTAGEQYSIEQAQQNTAAQLGNFVNSEAGTLLVTGQPSGLASTALYMGQFAQMICVYDNYYMADEANGINNAYNDINKAIYCASGDNCPFASPSNEMTLTLPAPSNPRQDCGSVKFSVKDDYVNAANAIIQPQLAGLNSLARSYYQRYNESGAVSGDSAQAIATSLYSMTSSSLVSIITSYVVQASGGQISNTEQQWVDNLTAGGWAMAANNFFYFAYTMFQSYSDNSSSSSAGYSAYLYIKPQQTADSGFSFCESTSNGGLGSDMIRATCSNLTTSQSNGVGQAANCIVSPNSNGCGAATPAQNYSTSSMTACAKDINQCENIKQYVMANEDQNGEVVVTAKDYVKAFYNGWTSQISNMDDVKSFADIESMNKLCNIPFASSTINACTGDSSFISPDDAETVIIPAGIGIIVGLVVMPVRLFWLPVVAIFASYYTGIAMYSNYADVYDLWTDPNKFYPDTLAFSVQSATYFTVKAWFDTFANSQGFLFLFPVQAISMFGFRVLLNQVAFIFNVGTSTFAANITMTVKMFMRKVILDAGISLIQWYGNVLVDYGYYWFYTQLFQFQSVLFSLEENSRLGVPLPPPFFFLIWIIFIPLWIGMIIASITIVIGFLVKVLSLVATIAAIFDPSEIVLQMSSFVISKYNPLYFAIATPLIAFATLFAFFLPLYPVVIYTLTVITWVTQYIETILAMPIVLLGMANPEGHSPLLGKAEKAIMLLAILFMRPITIVMGFVFGNLMASVSTYMFYNIVVPLMDMQIGSWAKGYALLILGNSTGITPVIDTGEATIQAVMTMLMLVMFTMLYYYMILNAYSLIYKLPNSVTSWIGLSMMNNAQEEEILQQISGEINNMTGSLTSASTEISGKQGQLSAAGGELDASGAYDKGKSSAKADVAQGRSSGGLGNMGKRRDKEIAEE
ncbi:MAG: hypothetical protein CMF43_01100 [Legionellales bacterium]|nr:hypothetical protein [Legionellales bacterium]